MTIGFGIIGCGMIARFHAKAVADIKGAKVVACYDAIPASADKYAAEIGCKAYHKLDDMLADPAVNIVTIGTRSEERRVGKECKCEWSRHVRRHREQGRRDTQGVR